MFRILLRQPHARAVKSSPSKAQFSPPTTKTYLSTKSGSSSSSNARFRNTFALLAVPTSLTGYLIYDTKTSENPILSQLGIISASSSAKLIKQQSYDELMATLSGQIPPGRPETLTKEEEAKLKELWAAVLKVFGLGSTEEAAAHGGVPVADKTVEQLSAGVAETSISGDKEKKHRTSKIGSMLSRKKDTAPETTPAATTTTTTAAPAAQYAGAISEKDDKHGSAKDFQNALSNQTPAELREAFWDMVKCDNPDGLLLRFLRARKWNVDQALVMMVATMHWRQKEMKVIWTLNIYFWGWEADRSRSMRLPLPEKLARLRPPITIS